MRHNRRPARVAHRFRHTGSGIAHYKPAASDRPLLLQAACFSPDALRLASCGGHRIELHELTFTQPVRPLVHEKVTAICWSKGADDKERIVSGSEDGTIKVWEQEWQRANPDGAPVQHTFLKRAGALDASSFDGRHWITGHEYQ